MKFGASLKHFLCKLKQKPFLTKLNMINCILLVLLLLVSMDKFSFSGSCPKLRPINSSRGTFNYNVARFLFGLLSLLIPNDYSCRYTFSFVSQIKNANISRKCLVSYNATRRFTNIPLQEIIDVAINLIFNHNLSLNITKK